MCGRTKPDRFGEERLDRRSRRVGGESFQTRLVIAIEVGLQDLADMVRCHARLRPHPDEEPRPARTVQGFRVCGCRNEYVRYQSRLCADERLRRNADYLEDAIAEAKHGADGAGILVKPARPVVVAHDCHRTGADGVVGRPYQTAKRRRQAERAEHIARDELPQDPLGLLAVPDRRVLRARHADDHDVGHAREQVTIGHEGWVVEVLARVRFAAGIHEAELHVEQAVGIGHWQRTQQHRVHDAEGGDRRADGEAQRENGRRADRAVPGNLAPAEDGVGLQRVEPREAALIAQRLERRVDGAPLARPGLGGQGGVRAQLLLEVLVRPPAAHRAEQALQPFPQPAKTAGHDIRSR